MPVSVVVGDLTRLPVDAIVNAANTALAPGGGVCGAIFAAAGYGELDRACRAIGGCPTGQAVLTPGFALPAKYIIHTAGPIWHGGGQGEAKLLRSCYDTSLCLAWDQGCRSIAFPLISAGIYGYPKQEALEIALDAMARFAQDHPMDITLAVLDPGIAWRRPSDRREGGTFCAHRSGGGPPPAGGEIPGLPAAGPQGQGAAVGVCRRQGRAGGDETPGFGPGMPGGAGGDGVG